METTEKIVEAYVRYVKGWFTIPNIKCKGQKEIDLLAIDPRANGRMSRYHIESGVSISKSYSGLTDKPFSVELLKQRVQKAGQRRTLGYFIEYKFEDRNVVAALAEYGFQPGQYQRVIVTWGWTDGVDQSAARSGILLWDFRDILREIAKQSRAVSAYFADDTMRTLQLMARTTK